MHTRAKQWGISRCENRTWNTGAECDENDGRHRVLDAERAAEVRGHIADDGRHNADAADRHHKAQIAAANVCETMER